jgi:hypothetical protein
MILRRIAHHVKQQQWTAVLIELVILILGVFLGFQVSDWAKERANRSAEARHLEEIAEDLRADRTTLLGRANLVRSTAGNRTGFEALLGAGGMQKIRDRQISRQLQVYYTQLDEMTELTVILKQLRAEGVAIGHTLGLSAFGEMDPDKLSAIVRGSPAYSAYLRTNREWAAIFLGMVNQQQQQALHLLGDIDEYLGKRAP